MNHQEHVNLIKRAISRKGGIWADLGSGDGAFTLALRDLAGPEVEIYSVDKDRIRLNNQKKVFNEQFSNTMIHYVQQDFTNTLDIPLLDGILMANSLHYVSDHVAFLLVLAKYLRPKGKLVLVEYSLDQKNPPWVPYPLSFPTFQKEAAQAGFTKITLLEKIPSIYWEEMYAAETEK